MRNRRMVQARRPRHWSKHRSAAAPDDERHVSFFRDSRIYGRKRNACCTYTDKRKMAGRHRDATNKIKRSFYTHKGCWEFKRISATVVHIQNDYVNQTPNGVHVEEYAFDLVPMLQILEPCKQSATKREDVDSAFCHSCHSNCLLSPKG